MSTIKLRTNIPGPKSKALSERRAKAVPRGLSHGTPIYVAKAEGAWLEDVDGNRYLDFAGGIGCLNVGHRRDAVVDAVRNQLDRFLHTCVQVTPYESYVRLAERMNEVTPGKFTKKTIFVNSGAEAVENAVKIARAYTKRPGIIAFEDAFHGRTMMTLALTSKTHPYKAGFAPFPSEVYRVPLRVLLSLFVLEKVSVVRSLLRAASGGHVQASRSDRRSRGRDRRAGSGRRRIRCAAAGLLQGADRDLPQIRHPLYCGRSAIRIWPHRPLFASEHYGIEPDLLVTAKSIGGGLPLAAVTGRAEIMDAPGPGGLGGTFAGNPLSCAAALAVLDLFERENLLARANELGDRFQRRAREWQHHWPIIGDVRGLAVCRPSNW